MMEIRKYNRKFIRELEEDGLSDYFCARQRKEKKESKIKETKRSPGEWRLGFWTGIRKDWWW